MVVLFEKKKLAKRDLSKITLAAGGHGKRKDGVCVMEAVTWAAGREHTDHPPCVSPVIATFLRSWNDSMGDEDRQMLKPYVFRVLDTATGKADEETRAWLCTDWLVRECAPAWLRLVGLTAQAEALEALAPLTNSESARAAQPTLNVAKKDAAAAGDSAWAAAWVAAWVAARDSAWAAAWDSAGDSAWAAARAAARDSARAAAGDAARAAARDSARDSARGAAGVAIKSTTKGLQKSALLLLDRMIAVGT